MVGDSEEEDEADDATVGCACPCDGVVEAGVVAGGAEGAAHGGGHDGIHGDEAEAKGGQPQHAPRGAAQVGGEEEERQLAGSFGAYAVEDADDEDRFAVVDPLKMMGLRRLRVEAAANLPGEPEDER